MSRYDRPRQHRVLLFTQSGLELNVLAKTSGELAMYERLAKSNLKPMVKGLGPLQGVVLVIDEARGSIKTTWSKLGVSPAVLLVAADWLEKNRPESSRRWRDEQTRKA